jgi:outer membrane protein assembly factor BamB
MKASPVADGMGNTYLASMSGAVSSFTPAGVERWRVQMPDGISASPALDPSDRALFLGTLGGEAYSLAPSSGRVLWKRRIESQSDERILSDLLFLPDERVIVLNSWGGKFHALEAETGFSRFTWSAGVSSYSAAAASSDGILYTLRIESTEEKAGLVCTALDPRSQEETEIFHQARPVRAANRVTVAASPILDEGRKRLYFVSNLDSDSQLHAICLATKKILWSKDFRRFIVGTPALLADGSVVVADLSGIVHVVTLMGSPKYRYHTGAYYLLAGPVCDRKGTIFVGDPQGRLHLLAPNGTGKIIFEAHRSIEARPAFDPEGRLCLPSNDGRVYVFPQLAG